MKKIQFLTALFILTQAAYSLADNTQQAPKTAPDKKLTTQAAPATKPAAATSAPVKQPSMREVIEKDFTDRIKAAYAEGNQEKAQALLREYHDTMSAFTGDLEMHKFALHNANETIEVLKLQQDRLVRAYDQLQKKLAATQEDEQKTWLNQIMQQACAQFVVAGADVLAKRITDSASSATWKGLRTLWYKARRLPVPEERTTPLINLNVLSPEAAEIFTRTARQQRPYAARAPRAEEGAAAAGAGSAEPRGAGVD